MTNENMVDLYAVGVIVSWVLAVMHVRREVKRTRYWWRDEIPGLPQYEYIRWRALFGFLAAFLWPAFLAVGGPIVLIVWIDSVIKRQFIKSYNAEGKQ